jgi:hypothetical protein
MSRGCHIYGTCSQDALKRSKERVKQLEDLIIRVYESMCTDPNGAPGKEVSRDLAFECSEIKETEEEESK